MEDKKSNIINLGLIFENTNWICITVYTRSLLLEREKASWKYVCEWIIEQIFTK